MRVRGSSGVGFIVSLNLRRRDLDKSQKAALGVELLPHYEAEAKERQADSARRNQPQAIGQKVADLPPSEKAKARDQAAKQVGVSGRLVSNAKLVKAADPEMFEKVKRGEMTVGKAVAAVREEARQRQREGVGPDGSGGRGKKKTLGSKEPEVSAPPGVGRVTQQIADVADVSPATVKRHSHVQKHGATSLGTAFPLLAVVAQLHEDAFELDQGQSHLPDDDRQQAGGGYSGTSVGHAVEGGAETDDT